MSETRDRYAKIAGRFWRHPKVLGLSDSAGWLWTRALSYQPDQLTDGAVSLALLRTLGHATEVAAEELVAAGLWERVRSGGYRFHDYADHNLTSDRWESEKARKRRNKADSRAASDGPVTTNVTGDMHGDTPAPVTAQSPPSGAALSDAGRRTQDARDLSDLNLGGDLDQVARTPVPSAEPHPDLRPPTTTTTTRGIGASPPPAAPFHDRLEWVRAIWHTAFVATGSKPPPWMLGFGTAEYVELTKWIFATHAGAERSTLEQLAQGFAKNPFAKKRGWPFRGSGGLITGPGEFLENGHAKPSSFDHVTRSALERLPEDSR